MRLWTKIVAFRSSEAGTSLVEYAMVISFIAFAALVALRVIGVKVDLSNMEFVDARW
jgi:Flp pilus assembly pilin Flp